MDVLRLWAGSKLIFDRRDPVVAMPEGWSSSPAGLFTGQSKYKYKIHLGTEDQEPDGLIVRRVLEETGEADAVPAHRGLVYIVFDRLPLAEWNNRRFLFRRGEDIRDASGAIPVLRGAAPFDVVMAAPPVSPPVEQPYWLERYFDEGLQLETYRLHRTGEATLQLSEVASVRPLTVSVEMAAIRR